MSCLVWVVCILVGIILVSAWGSVVIPWQWWMSPVGFLNLAVAHTLLGLMFYSYYLTVTTCPGRVPHGWIPPGATAEELQKAIDDEEAYRRAKRRRGRRAPARVWEKGAVRYCGKCQEFKPPRAHHCSDCGVCTLKMDHHCPWVGNCVGQANHKTFVLFLVYAILGLTYAAVLFVIRLIDVVQLFTLVQKAKNAPRDPMVDPTPAMADVDMRWPALYMAVSAVNIILVVPIVLSLMCLLGYQLGLLAENVTTIEDFEREVLQKRAKQQGKPFTWHYDLGSCRENYRQVLGPDIKRWLVPWPSQKETDAPLVDSKDTV